VLYIKGVCRNYNIFISEVKTTIVISSKLDTGKNVDILILLIKISLHENVGSVGTDFHLLSAHLFRELDAKILQLPYPTL